MQERAARRASQGEPVGTLRRRGRRSSSPSGGLRDGHFPPLRETEDTFVADLAVAVNAGQIKTGSVARASGPRSTTSSCASRKAGSRPSWPGAPLHARRPVRARRPAEEVEPRRLGVWPWSCVRWCRRLRREGIGPAWQMRPTCGRRARADHPARAAADLAKTVERLRHDPLYIEKLAREKWDSSPRATRCLKFPSQGSPALAEASLTRLGLALGYRCSGSRSSGSPSSSTARAASLLLDWKGMLTTCRSRAATRPAPRCPTSRAREGPGRARLGTGAGVAGARYPGDPGALLDSRYPHAKLHIGWLARGGGALAHPRWRFDRGDRPPLPRRLPPWQRRCLSLVSMPARGERPTSSTGPSGRVLKPCSISGTIRARLDRP